MVLNIFALETNEEILACVILSFFVFLPLYFPLTTLDTGWMH